MLIPSKEEVLAHVTVLPKEVRKRLEARGLPLIDLQGPLEQAARTRSPYYKRDIHLNEFGNEVVARFLAGWYKTRTFQSTVQMSRFQPENETR